MVVLNVDLTMVELIVLLMLLLFDLKQDLNSLFLI